ncbi:MAG: CapA family protein, partial [Desulfobacteraceae bacterium]|nr:CapA family protein [Desulfobacteraceae bacterium]
MTRYKIVLIGDISFNGLISKTPDKNKKRFEQIRHILKSCYTIANLESPVRGEFEYNEAKLKNGVINTAEKAITKDLLKALNINAVTLANNHIYDQKDNGVKETIEVINSLGILYTGACSPGDKSNPVIFSNNNKKIGIISFVHEDTNPGDINKSIINVYDKKQILKNIKTNKDSVDYLIVS